MPSATSTGTPAALAEAAGRPRLEAAIGALRTLCLSLLGLLALEGASRVVHLGARPMIPYRTGADGASRMGVLLDTAVTLQGYGRLRYVTDDVGARVASVERRATERQGATLVVGDSQSLGWGQPFEATFASHLAQGLTGDATDAVILASAANDPEASLGWVAEYAQRHPVRHGLALVALNLGNDLDEMYLGRRDVRTRSPITEWLSSRSFLFLDMALLRQRAFGETQSMPPGTNPTVFALQPEELRVLVDETAQVLRRSLQALPPAERKAVLIVPNDYQIDLSEMKKYRAAYPDPAVFQGWLDRAPEAAQRLDAVSRHVAERLRQQGILVVESAGALRQAATQARMFDDYSHHLTREGHVVVAATVRRALEGQP